MEGLEHLIFFYGTLKRSQPNHDYLLKGEGRAKFIADGITDDKYPLVIASQYNIPFLLDKEGVGNRIHGEIFAADDKKLAHVDFIENVPKYYNRIKIGVTQCDSGEKVSCWLYLLAKWQPIVESFHYHAEYDSNGSHGQAYVQVIDRLSDPKFRADLSSVMVLND